MEHNLALDLLILDLLRNDSMEVDSLTLNFSIQLAILFFFVKFFKNYGGLL